MVASASPRIRKPSVGHPLVTRPPHHEGIPLGGERSGGKILVQMRETAPSGGDLTVGRSRKRGDASEF
jgi:hypothetical protein